MMAPNGHDDGQTLRETLRRMIADAGDDMAEMRVKKPNVTDGHSDGVRVRYVKRATTIETLTAVLAMLGAEDAS